MNDSDEQRRRHAKYQLIQYCENLKSQVHSDEVVNRLSARNMVDLIAAIDEALSFTEAFPGAHATEYDMKRIQLNIFAQSILGWNGAGSAGATAAVATIGHAGHGNGVGMKILKGVGVIAVNAVALVVVGKLSKALDPGFYALSNFTGNHACLVTIADRCEAVAVGIKRLNGSREA